MSALLVRGGRVVDPSEGLDALLDVRVRAGRIFEIGEHLVADADEAIVDAANCIVAPGFVDMHVHFREPGQTHKETIATGAAAAVAGGFTTVACMPNTEPALDSPTLLRETVRKAAFAGLARVVPIAALTRGRKGDELAAYHLLAEAGAVAFSDDGTTIANPRVLRNAAQYASDLPQPFISHCIDMDLHGDAVMNEGEHSARLGLDGSPGLAEEIVVARDLLIAGDTGKAWHIAHLSTAGSLDLVRWARTRGIRASCEVTPHHLLLRDDRFEDYTAVAKVAPPLREEHDAAALRAGVRSGDIDVFATDHAPHGLDEKAQLLSQAPVGFTGLEIALGAYALALPDLSLDRFIAMGALNPARLLGLDAGTLAVGAPADITIFADRIWTVDAKRFFSKGKNTPFDGMTLPRRVVTTIVGGAIAYADGRIFPRTMVEV
jgi:dihydroorotase